MFRFATFCALSIVAVASVAATSPSPEDTWPGFRGHGMSGIAPGNSIPEKWSTTENVRWKVDVPGQGWSSPIVWGDTVFITSGISGKPFKQPTPGLYGNEYIAELSAHNEALAAEITRLREDPQAVEELAREELGLLKDGELLVILRDVPAPSPLPDAARAESSRPRR